MTNLFELALLVSSSSSNLPRPLSNFEFFNWSKIAWLKWILFASPKDSQFATVAKSWKILHPIFLGAKFSYPLKIKIEIKFKLMTHFSKKAPSRHQRSNNTCNNLLMGFLKIKIFIQRFFCTGQNLTQFDSYQSYELERENILNRNLASVKTYTHPEALIWKMRNLKIDDIAISNSQRKSCNFGLIKDEKRILVSCES